jgi:hypothetical protein
MATAAARFFLTTSHGERTFLMIGQEMEVVVIRSIPLTRQAVAGSTPLHRTQQQISAATSYANHRH